MSGMTSSEDSLEQLHQMFSDCDKETLAAVLQANGGNVERTVEHMLSSPADGVPAGSGVSRMTTSSGGDVSAGGSSQTDHDAALALQLSREWSHEDPTLRAPPPTIPSGIPSPYDQAFRTQGREHGASIGNASGAPGPAGGSKANGIDERRGRRVALPEYFLRAPGWTPEGASSGDPQIAADARMAMMLQNESFQRELQADPELAHLSLWGRRRNQERNPDAAQGPSIREQITNMGNDVRRKVDELAIRWKLKEPGRAADTTEYHRIQPNSASVEDDDAEVVHFAQDSATRRSAASGMGGSSYQNNSSSSAGAGLFRADSGEEQLVDPRRNKKDR